MTILIQSDTASDSCSSEICPFPGIVEIEGVSVTAFPNPRSLFERICRETDDKTIQTVVHYLNIHVANTAFYSTGLKNILKQSDLVYCDGAGIALGAKMLGHCLPTRLTAADWFLDMLGYFADYGHRVYLLGGKPGVPEAVLDTVMTSLPQHSIVGMHHGYILNSPSLTEDVIDEINSLKPDILMVGLGTPLQEFWIERYREQLQVSTIYAVGAVMDFASGTVPRCPDWMGKNGLEWLYRLGTEPTRLLGRYVIGNPWFLGRVALQSLYRSLASPRN